MTDKDKINGLSMIQAKLLWLCLIAGTKAVRIDKLTAWLLAEEMLDVADAAVALEKHRFVYSKLTRTKSIILNRGTPNEGHKEWPGLLASYLQGELL